MSFLIVTDRLVLVPSPTAVKARPFRDFFRAVHADKGFTSMGFGDDWLPSTWSDDEVHEFILGRDVARRWGVRQMGDFAVAVTQERLFDVSRGRLILNAKNNARIIDTDDVSWADSASWVAYACVRDASNEIKEAHGESFELPDWRELLEVRYGVDPGYWGKGVAAEAQAVVMDWAVQERGAKRFIAETQKENARSAGVLRKLGFVVADTNWWNEKETTDEWELSV